MVVYSWIVYGNIKSSTSFDEIWNEQSIESMHDLVLYLKTCRYATIYLGKIWINDVVRVKQELLCFCQHNMFIELIHRACLSTKQIHNLAWKIMYGNLILFVSIPNIYVFFVRSKFREITIKVTTGWVQKVMQVLSYKCMYIYSIYIQDIVTDIQKSSKYILQESNHLFQRFSQARLVPWKASMGTVS